MLDLVAAQTPLVQVYYSNTFTSFTKRYKVIENMLCQAKWDLLPSLMFLSVFLSLAGVPLSPSPPLSWDLPAIETEELRYCWERQLGGDAKPM